MHLVSHEFFKDLSISQLNPLLRAAYERPKCEGLVIQSNWSFMELAGCFAQARYASPKQRQEHFCICGGETL